MSEFPPDPAQDEAGAPDEVSISAAQAIPMAEKQESGRAKITVPLPVEVIYEPLPSLPRAARPLALEEVDISDVTPGLSASPPLAKITRPLMDEAAQPENAAPAPTFFEDATEAAALTEKLLPLQASKSAEMAEAEIVDETEIAALVAKEAEADAEQTENEKDEPPTQTLPPDVAASAPSDLAAQTSASESATAEAATTMATTPEPVSTAAPPEPATTASELEPDLAVPLPALTLEATSPDLARHPTSPLALAEEEAADELAHHPTTPLTADQQARAPEDSTLQVPPQPTQAAPLPVFTHASVPSVPPPPRQPVGAMRQGNARLARWGDGKHPRSTPLSAEKQRRRLKRIYRRQYFSRKHLRRARAQDRRDRRRLWTTIWSTSTTLFLLFLALGGVAGYIAYNFIVATQGTYAGQVLTLRDLLPPDNLKIYDSQGRLIDQMTDQGIHTEIPYKQIAPDLLNATVAIEDHTFWQNQGVDIMGILRAAIADLNSQQQVQGGSTITQQLIKKLVVGDSDDIKRKLSELVLAPQVNNHYSKQDILEMYVNTIYYGHQAYGIEAAATVYFGLVNTGGRSAASQLDLAQAAFLAGLPRNASLYDPAVNTEAAYQRFSDVLQAMVAQHYITQVQAQTAYQEGTAPDFFKSSPTLIDQAPHFDEYVLSQLEQLYHLSRAQLSRSGLIVYTTLDVELQHKILKIMQQHIAEIRDAHHVTNAAEVLIDFHTGAIISMLGSIDYYDKAIDGQYNVALAYRQPGSSFKPYVYVTAFAQGASPAQAVDDASTTFQVPDSNPPTYTPSNYDEHFHGHMTLRCALQNSLNVPAVRVLQHVGIANSMNTAKAMGITTYEGTPGLSLVLGGLDVRLLDHTSAYGVFANGGVRQPYYSISKIVKSTTGKVLLQHQTTPGVQVLTPQLAYMMTSVLSDNTSRLPEFFDCNVLQLYANSQQDCYNGNRGQVRPAAAKTGTTQDFRDNWTVGYTTDFVMGVWAGNDDNSPMINVTGVQGAAPIWHDAMLLAEQGHPIRDFQNPGGLERATVTYADGVKSTDWFLPGTVPHNSTTPSHPDPAPASSTPYCSTFSFAFPPPAGSGIPANGAWW